MLSGHSDSAPAVFERVLCAVDGSAEGRRVGRECAGLMGREGALTLCTVVDPYAVESEAGIFLERALTRRLESALTDLQAEIGALRPVEAILREGPPARMLLAELTAERASLVALGGRTHRRAAGIVLGSVSTAMLHEAPCAVLLARGTADADPPAQRRVTVGYDGSPAARRALAVAAELCRRRGTELQVLIARAGAPRADRDGQEEETGEIEPQEIGTGKLVEDSREPVAALLSAAVGSGLLVLGSRSLHGLRALGSVSERVAHRATCSVLVVR
jgi:nucleotide-binding universal stress UspA family protein